jgi:hypothetical protein
MHGGHNQSVLHAVLLTGTETQTVTYHYVNGKESGSPVVSGLHRAYTIDADELSEQYRLPYSEQRLAVSLEAPPSAMESISTGEWQ